MDLNAYYVLRDVYACWMRGDLEGFGRHMATDIRFDVPSSTRSYIGTGQGRATLVERLTTFLADYEVLEFTLHSAHPIAEGFIFRIEYHYRSRSLGADVRGFQRHEWTVRGNDVATFVVMHDAQRLGAFFELCDKELV